MVGNSAAAGLEAERGTGAKSQRNKSWRNAGGKPRSAQHSGTATSFASTGFASKGDEIRARIAANRAKRLAIAEAMKREAGVTEHWVHQDKEDLSGLAYIGTGRILSPEGRRIVELYTLAHECGHIFLHNAGEGYWLPGHVKELEAESYAHQAFRVHGMRVPRRIADWGREYVGAWIASDRAAGIPIDPRALAYAAGTRSPYEPLRMVPSTWAPSGWPARARFRQLRLELQRGSPDNRSNRSTVTQAEQPAVPASAAAAVNGWAAPEPAAPAQASWMRRRIDRVQASLAPAVLETRAVLRLVACWAALGGAASLYALLKLEVLNPGVLPWQHFALSRLGLVTAATGGLLAANLAMLWRNATRLHPFRPGPTKSMLALAPDPE
ncbi:MAG TPA: hypothetical protein VFY92_01565 [Hyphomicrobiaceae bacterium]|nr:hypothetical protein [Hyphomicrobiaceae bacterium]